MNKYENYISTHPESIPDEVKTNIIDEYRLTYCSIVNLGTGTSGNISEYVDPSKISKDNFIVVPYSVSYAYNGNQISNSVQSVAVEISSSTILPEINYNNATGAWSRNTTYVSAKGGYVSGLKCSTSSTVYCYTYLVLF